MCWIAALLAAEAPLGGGEARAGHAAVDDDNYEDEGSDGGPGKAWSLEARRLAHGFDANMTAVPVHLKIEWERITDQHFWTFSHFKNGSCCWNYNCCLERAGATRSFV